MTLTHPSQSADSAENVQELHAVLYQPHTLSCIYLLIAQVFGGGDDDSGWPLAFEERDPAQTLFVSWGPTIPWMWKHSSPASEDLMSCCVCLSLLTVILAVLILLDQYVATASRGAKA